MLQQMEHHANHLNELEKRGIDVDGALEKNEERAREIAQRLALPALKDRLLAEFHMLAKTRTKQWIEASGITAEELNSLILDAYFEPDELWHELLGGEDWFDCTKQLNAGVWEAWADAMPGRVLTLT